MIGFHRGLELYGGQVSRTQQPYVQESLRQRGVVVVEGMNEVLRMETLGVVAVGLGSNKATQTQLEKLIRFARQAGDGQIVLLPDCDEEGEKAFRELLWKLTEHVDVRLGCTSTAFDGQFAGRQPESYTGKLIVAKQTVYEIADTTPIRHLRWLSPGLQILTFIQILLLRCCGILPRAEVVELLPDLLGPLAVLMRKKWVISPGLALFFAGLGQRNAPSDDVRRVSCRVSSYFLKFILPFRGHSSIG